MEQSRRHCTLKPSVCVKVGAELSRLTAGLHFGLAAPNSSQCHFLPKKTNTVLFSGHFASIGL